MFRYSGSKYRLRKHLRPPPDNVHTIVETMAGSARYGAYYKPKHLILFEKNLDVLELWEWLIKKATVERLHQLEALRPDTKIDVRELKLPKPEETLIRLTCSGAYVGQLSSWVLYPQHSINFKEIINNLDWLQSGAVIIGGDDYQLSLAFNGAKGTLFFVDPPYLKTGPNYIDKSKKKDLSKELTAKQISDYIDLLKNPTIFTYGTDAPEVFPKYDWKLACERHVPKIRTGGTVLRKEHAFYHNWPKERKSATAQPKHK